MQIASDIQTLEQIVQSLHGDTKSKSGVSINADSEMVCIMSLFDNKKYLSGGERE